MSRWIDPLASVSMLKRRKGPCRACACGHAWGVHAYANDACLVKGCTCDVFAEEGAEMKYAKRRDANEWAIVAALEAVGANVTRLDTAGVPDLLVAFRSRTFLLEVKDPAQAGKAYRAGAGAGRQPLTPAQVKWWGLPWNGDERRVVETVKEALEAIGYKGAVP